MIKAYMKRLHRYLVIIILINSGLLPLKSLPSNYEINKNNKPDKKQLVHKDFSSKRPNIFLSNKGDQNKLELSGLGKELVIKQKLIKNRLRFLITGDISKFTTESFSRPNEGIELVLIKPNKEFLEVDILFSDYIDLSTINIQKKSDDIHLTYGKAL